MPSISKNLILVCVILLIIIALASVISFKLPPPHNTFNSTTTTVLTNADTSYATTERVTGSFTSISSFDKNVSWASLHGVNYAWGALGIQCCAGAPSTDFPVIHSFGFNLIRVPLSWNTYEQNSTAYVGYLDQVANEADMLGIYIVYDAHTSGSNSEPGYFFPTSLSSSYGNGSSFFNSWWTNQVNYKGQPGWTAVWKNFWTPVIQVVDSHPSTLGYEIDNEPHPDGAPLSDLQAYNQFIANHIQSVSSKYIVFMGPYVSLQVSSDEAVAPTGITKLVMDAHCYIGTSSQPDTCAENGGMQQNLASVSSVGSSLGIPIWIGEWAVCSPGGCGVSQPQAASIIQKYTAEFGKNGFANSYWIWKCDTDPSSVGQTDLLTAYPGCSAYWLDAELSSAEA